MGRQVIFFLHPYKQIIFQLVLFFPLSFLSSNVSAQEKADTCRHVTTEDFFEFTHQFFPNSMTNPSKLKNLNSITSDTSDIVFGIPGDVYCIYVRNASSWKENILLRFDESFLVYWFDLSNREGLQRGTVKKIQGDEPHSLGAPPMEPNKAWMIFLKRVEQE